MAIRIHLIFLITFLITITSIAADRITLITKDGYVINVPMNSNYTNIVIEARTDYGNLRFNILSVQKIILVTNNVHSITTFKGETLQGTITSPNLIIPTRYGTLTILPSEIAKLIIFITNVGF